MTVAAKNVDAPKSQADLLYDAQLRKERQFRFNVAFSWILLLVILVFLFSGQEIIIGSWTFNAINIDSEFIKQNLVFIAGGIGETIRSSAIGSTACGCRSSGTGWSRAERKARL